jgi:adenine/guanine phosphoribosyltransferase-like PRPP-binding protein
MCCNGIKCTLVTAEARGHCNCVLFCLNLNVDVVKVKEAVLPLQLIKHHNIKEYGNMEEELHAFLMFSLATYFCNLKMFIG